MAIKQACQTGFACVLSVILSTITATADDVEFKASLYGWGIGIGTEIETPRGTIERDIGFDDLLDDLEIAALGSIEAHTSGFSFLLDTQYFELESDIDRPLSAGLVDASADTKFRVISLYGLYRIHNGTRTKVDLGGGIRHSNLDLSVALTAGSLTTEVFSSDRSETDPVLALRAAHDIASDWTLTGMIDYGGFGIGTDMTAQATATLEYDWTKRWSGALGYRYLTYDSTTDFGDITIDYSGPILGLSYTF
ncbi:MAG: hypothetical protein AAFZ91_07530 [Pseudomonadota bacterium]